MPLPGRALPLLLTIHAAVVSYLAAFTSGPSQVFAFHLSFGTAELYYLVGAYRIYGESKDELQKRLFRRSAGGYIAGIACWALDISVCPQLSGLPGGIPNPQLHAWWHVLVASASYSLILAVLQERLGVLNEPVRIRWWWGYVPVLAEVA